MDTPASGPSLIELSAEPGWDERIGTCSDARKLTLLAEADALGSGDDAQRVVTLRTYRALESCLDPARPADCDRTEWILDTLVDVDRAFEPLLRRAAERAARPVVRRRAGVAVGVFHVNAGNLAEAEASYLRVLAESRGLGGIPERAACFHLCRLYGSQRRVFEAYVMARHALRMFTAAADESRVFLSWIAITGALYEMREWEAFEQAASVAAEAVAALPERLVERAEAELGVCRFNALRARSRPADALAVLDAHLSGTRTDPYPHTMSSDWWRYGMRAAVLSDLGRLDEARDLFDQARNVVTPDDRNHATLLQLEAVCAVLRGEADLALSKSAELLALEPGVLVSRLGTGAAIELLHRLAAALRDHGHVTVARQALDRAAVIAVERIREAAQAVRNLPELAFVPAEDRELLASARTRFADEHQDLLQSLAELFERAHEAGEPWIDTLRVGDHTLVCAWCALVKEPDGTWVPVGQFLPHTGPIRLTHGICPDCRERIQARLG